MKNKKYFIGIDLAWKRRNRSYVVVLDSMANIIHSHSLSFDEIAPFLQQHIDPSEAIIGVDAPLIVNNESGNRCTEVEFLKSYSKYKLGAYPVNRRLLTKSYGLIVGEELSKILKAYELVEVYPHATILNLFNDAKVLPYKYKKGRNKAFYMEQLVRYTGFLESVTPNLDKKLFDGSTLKTLKKYEDYLDSITCAYSLYYANKYNYESYGSQEEGLLIVPI